MSLEDKDRDFGGDTLTQWRPFIGKYEKRFYWCRKRGTTVATRCWPNAGEMHAVDGTGRSWSESDGIEITEDNEDD